jgi:transcriptional regulator with XRE-family HTH domain
MEVECQHFLRKFFGILLVFHCFMRKFVLIFVLKGGDNMGVVNERIKSRRLQLGYTLLYIADQLGVQEATVQRYESGDIKNIKHETIVSLSKILCCDPAFLMGWQSDPVSISSLSSDDKTLLRVFHSLNEDGQHKLIERAEELRSLGYVKGETKEMA